MPFVPILLLSLETNPTSLTGADPYQIEILLKRRGDYRPHQASNAHIHSILGHFNIELNLNPDHGCARSVA